MNRYLAIGDCYSWGQEREICKHCAMSIFSHYHGKIFLSAFHINKYLIMKLLMCISFLSVHQIHHKDIVVACLQNKHFPLAGGCFSKKKLVASDDIRHCNIHINIQYLHSIKHKHILASFWFMRFHNFRLVAPFLTLFCV